VKYCENCGKPLTENNNVCKYCGYEVKTKNIDDKIKELKNKLLREKEILINHFKNSDNKQNYKENNNDANGQLKEDKIFSKDDRMKNDEKDNYFSYTPKTQVNSEPLKPTPLPNPVPVKPAPLPNPIHVNPVPLKEQFTKTEIKQNNTNETFAVTKISKEAQKITSFTKGEYIKDNNLSNGFFGIIIFSLLILGTLFFNYTFSATALKGADPIFSLFKKTNNFDVLLADLVASGSKNAKIFGYLDYALAAFAGFCILNIITALIFIKKPRAIRFFCNFNTTLLLLLITAIGLSSGIIYGFTEIIKGIAVLSALLLIVVLYFIINISYNKK
jgi:hypothetical protein